ncbi:MAG: insulinase family protein [Parcubacteria group bacterium]|nr:insulinase family protein [Parcubacteria group bacterium]
MRPCYRVKSGVLDNGLRFYTQYDDSSSREMAVLAVNVGSIHDPDDKKGLAHTLEHVICAKTKNLSAKSIDALFARRMGGPDDNFFITTSRTCTTYGPADYLKKSHSQELFKIFAEMIRNPILSTDIKKIEQAAINQEHYLRGEDIAEIYIVDILYGILFSKSPVGYPVDGVMPDVRNIRIKDLRNHAERFYRPSNTFVVYLGPKHTEARKIINDALGDWGLKHAPDTPGLDDLFMQPFAPLAKSMLTTIKCRGIRQWHVCIGLPTEPYRNDATALDILARILSDRLYHRLRTENIRWKQGVYRAPVWTEHTFAHGLFASHFATLDGDFVPRIIDTFQKECMRLGETLISREEIETWVGFMYDYEFMDCFQRSPGNLTDMIIDAVSNGDTDLAELHQRGEKLLSFRTQGGRKMLRDISRKYLGNTATVIMKPEPA